MPDVKEEIWIEERWWIEKRVELSCEKQSVTPQQKYKY